MAGTAARKKILIVDNARENIDVLREIFRSDFKLSIALNGEQAMRVVRSEAPPDLILLDIMMPGMDGYEVCRRLKADETTRTIPIVFVTAKAKVEDEAKGFQLGASDYITKPFNPQIIRQRVKTHLELKQHRDQLEDLVRKRTSQFEAAKNAAEAANYAKDEFLAIISHELRTPLNSILGFTSLLLSDPSMAEAERVTYLGNVSENSHDLLDLINEMIELVRVDDRDVRQEKNGFSLYDLLDGVFSAVAAEAEGKGLTLSRRVNTDVPELITGNSKRLRQVLRHLMHNAVKFTSKGSVSMAIVREASPPGKLVLRFSIEDTGIGVPLDKQEGIFQHFIQLESVMTRRHGGMGLGLTVCKRYVPLMGGRVWMESTPGKGSVFHFTACFATG